VLADAAMHGIGHDVADDGEWGLEHWCFLSYCGDAVCTAGTTNPPLGADGGASPDASRGSACG